ncbi:MAG: lipoyl(octanoyl) transferase LipB [Endozoicomonas sp.]
MKSSLEHSSEVVQGEAVVVRWLGRQDYEPVWQAMKNFTNQRDENTSDEFWFLEHDPVFTQGQAGKPEHILMPGDIPVIPVDRGGQVTYHGPGQLVCYFLLDIKRKLSGPRAVVFALENAVIEVLASYGIKAKNKPEAPGVYIDGAKIASLGLRFRKMCSYHGLSLNVDMDLEPFSRINPCGYAGLDVVDMKSVLGSVDIEEVSQRLLASLQKALNYRGKTTL